MRCASSSRASHSKVTVYDTTRSALLKVFTLEAVVWSVAVDREGRWVAAGDYASHCTVFDIASGEILAQHKLGWQVREVAAAVWPSLTTTSRLTRRFIWSVCFSLDSRCLACGCWDATARVYVGEGNWGGKGGQGAPTWRSRFAHTPPPCRYWTTDGVKAVSEATASTTASTQEVKEQATAPTPLGPSSPPSSPAAWTEAWRVTRSDRVFSVSLSQDAGILAVGGRDNVVAIYSLPWPATSSPGSGTSAQPTSAPQLLLELPQLENRVYACALRPDARRVAFGGVGKEVVVWDVDANTEVQRLYTGANVQSVAFSPDGLALAAGGESKHVEVWDESAQHDATALYVGVGWGGGG